MDGYNWVVAFDKRTGIRAAFTVCPPNNVPFYVAKYELSGYSVRIFTMEEAKSLASWEKSIGIM